MATALDFAALMKKMKAEAGRAAAAPRPAPRPAQCRQLRDFVIASPDPRLANIYVVPEFVSPAEEAALVARIEAEPFVDLGTRQLQNWGGVPSAGAPMVETPLPPFLADLAARFDTEFGLYSADTWPNHVLLNKYERGQGIALHADGPLYAPLVVDLSLGHAVAFDFHALDSPELLLSVPVPARSVLVFDSSAYLHARHGIAGGVPRPAVDLDEPAVRYSLTFRRVREVADGAARERMELMTPEQQADRQRALARHLRGVSEA